MPSPIPHGGFRNDLVGVLVIREPYDLGGLLLRVPYFRKPPHGKGFAQSWAFPAWIPGHINLVHFMRVRTFRASLAEGTFFGSAFRGVPELRTTPCHPKR